MDTKKGRFYIGRDSATDEPLIYKADGLTTHGVIVGMTGSGKTGLGVNVIEEALLSGIPTLVIDPKGDLGNIGLIFPENRPEDLEPWMDEAKAKRKGVTTQELAVEESAERIADLAEDEITQERIGRLRDSTDVTIYTPGSSAGVGLNILGSLEAPELDFETSGEVIRDEIEGIVSSILVLAGIESDPVSGPEHILLATIVETWWRQGKDLDLANLVAQIPKPPFRKLGVFELDTFMPEKERMALALKLNGLLASPSFAAWLEGEPLDVEELLMGSDKTRCAVIYMAHLSDEERQFVVSLLLSKVVTWIRSQPGSSELRALIFMDEAFGYAPPTAEPPSKKPIMTILKQARAFGVGLILVTQNPIDLDYKAMSNAGTWIVGRLQTENDKRRILEGMETLDQETGIVDLDTQISNLAKRQFILHRAKKSGQELFRRRQSMCFRYGPLTREQVSSMMEGRRQPTQAPKSPDSTTPEPPPAPVVLPDVADGVEVVHLDPGASWASVVGADPTATRYSPAAAVTVQLLYDDTKAGINHSEVFEAVVHPLDGLVEQGEVFALDHDDRDFTSEALAGASYETGDLKLRNKTFWTGLGADLKTYLVANQKLDVWACPGLKLYSRVGETEEQFRARCQEATETAADAAVAKLTDRYKTRIDRLKDQISAADHRVAELEGEASAKQQDELLSGAGDLLGALLGGRKSSNPLGKAASRRAATHKARARVDTAQVKLDEKQTDLIDLEDELAEAINEIVDEQAALAEQVEVVQIPLEKTDIRVAEAKLVWVPVS